MSSVQCSPDFLIVGGGVIGLRIAIEAKRRHPDCSVVLLEKEERCGIHASGRNSGVLHAGFYYDADSFKARFTRDGNARLQDYCDEGDLSINRCGKLVVARDADEVPVLDELLQRGKVNGVELQRITAAEAREIEPRVRTHEYALYSPSTATVDPSQVVGAFVDGARRIGVEVRTGVAYLGRNGSTVKTSAGSMEAGYVVNAGGLYADQLARAFGFSERYHILPFKGLYLYADPSAPPLRTNVYPVPDLAMPFLGVHFTVKVDGAVTVGPTAVPALWREQYSGLQGFNAGEFVQIARLEGRMFVGNRAKFRSVALRELPKYYKRYLVRRAGSLVDGVWPGQFRRWGPAGIRAQLVDIENYKLVTDFVVEGDDRSFHILNAVSPAFTCAIPFAEFVLDEIALRTS